MSEVTTYYLEMLSPSLLKSIDDPKGLVVSECSIKQFEFNKFLYRFIGEKWLWTDKLPWSDQQWRDYVENDNLRTFVAYFAGSIAGYFELLRDINDVEIIYFGLAEQSIGKGHGGYLLTKEPFAKLRFSFKIKACEKFYHRHIFDIPRIKF